MIHKVLLFVLTFGLVPVHTFGQDSLKFQEIPAVSVNKKRIIQRQGLYDSYEIDNTKSINGFTQLTIFKGQMSDEVWSSDGKQCVDMSLDEKGKEKFLNVKWNKDQEECDWVGIGFGWDFWSAKDMGEVVHISAIEIQVRSKGKTMTNLPWAFGLEDYAGGQAWLGFSQNFAPNGEITNEWTKVQIPLALFPFQEYDCDPSNIKQLLIQLFAQDEVEIYSIEIVPFKGKLKKEVVSEKVNRNEIRIDGDLSEWINPFIEMDNNHSFSIKNSEDSLYMAFKITDDTPRMNTHQKGDLWNGDAIEITFATNPNANPKRNLFLLSDYHIGINCGEKPYLWNFSDDEPFKYGKTAIVPSSDGYVVELAIAWSELTNTKLAAKQVLGFEIAIDEGNETNSRQQQIRWNSNSNEGFHVNPSKWGVLELR